MLKIKELRTEYLTTPLGMDEAHPRFSYRLEGDSKFQSARRLTVTAGDRVVWKTGWVDSVATTQIAYAGEELAPFTRYEWQVTVRDDKGVESDPVSSFFETGFGGESWRGSWIGEAPHTDNRRPVPRFRKDFAVSKCLASARLHVTALGLYEVGIDGRPVTEKCFTPGWTQYFDRVQYQTYDVTQLLPEGAHRLSVLVGDGWYCGRIARRDNGRVSYGDQVLLKLELHLRYADGSVQKVVTDEAWEVSPSEIVMSDIYDGEHVQAWRQDPAEALPSGKLHPNARLCSPAARTVWNSGPAVRRQEVLKPRSVTRRADGKVLVDFGQNFAGRERLTLHGARRGEVITCRHGEMLYPDGALYTENLRSSLARTVYEANDDELQIIEPRFTYYGFRYLEIDGWPGELHPEEIEAVALYSDLPATGGFASSHPLLNQLFSNILWGQKSNFLDVPTDCPQRDERVPWTGDTQLFANVGSYNMFAAAFYRKWITDLNLSRDPDGTYPIVAPVEYRPWSEGGAVAGWSDAGIVCPWQMVRKYGDLTLAKECLEPMIGHLDRVYDSAHGELPDNARFGDWLHHDDPTSSPLISGCCLAGSYRLAARMAALTGESEAAKKCEARYREVARRCRERFLAPDGTLTETSQTAALLFLHFDVVTEAAGRKKIFDGLVDNVFVRRGGTLSTGFLGTPLLLPVLSREGRTDLAYRLLENTACPGWLYPVTQGATTMWERWDSWSEKEGFADWNMNSFNHYAYGAVGEWFYETMGGIKPLDEAPGFQKFLLAPEPGGSLTSVKIFYDSTYGRIESAWERQEKQLVWRFTVPCNTRAKIVFPGSPAQHLPSGITEEGGNFWADPGSYTVQLALP